MKKFLSVFLVLLCATISVFAFGVDDTMSKVMDSWKGCHIDKVIDVWGYPTEERTVAGHKIYIWKTERVVTSDEYSNTKERKDSKGRTYYETLKTGGSTEIRTSERILEVDDNNVVIKGRWSGDDLPFTFMGVAKEWLNPTYDLRR